MGSKKGLLKVSVSEFTRLPIMNCCCWLRMHMIFCAARTMTNSTASLDLLLFKSPSQMVSEQMHPASGQEGQEAQAGSPKSHQPSLPSTPCTPCSLPEDNSPTLQSSPTTLQLSSLALGTCTPQRMALASNTNRGTAEQAAYDTPCQPALELQRAEFNCPTFDIRLLTIC